MVHVELDPNHYETALTKALTRFRQRSDNSSLKNPICLCLL